MVKFSNLQELKADTLPAASGQEDTVDYIDAGKVEAESIRRLYHNAGTLKHLYQGAAARLGDEWEAGNRSRRLILDMLHITEDYHQHLEYMESLKVRAAQLGAKL